MLGTWTRLGARTLAAIVIVGGLSACGGDDETSTDDASATTAADGPTTAPPTTVAELPVAEFATLDGSFRTPTSLTAGWTKVVVTNEGTFAHDLQLARLIDGNTMADIEETLRQGIPASDLTSTVGGSPAIPPGATREVVLNIPEGDYIIFSVQPSPQGLPEMMTGMLAGFTVAGPEGDGTPPEADVSVTAADFAFEVPDELAAGPQIVEVVNAGPSFHEWIVVGVDPGTTVEDLIPYLGLRPPTDGPPAPWDTDTTTGLKEQSAGSTSYVSVDLEPGEYVAYCTVRTPERETHAQKGMVRLFTVA